jgi:nucleoside recognition membrane protein YjiH
MAYISYVFTLQPGKKSSYNAPSGFEVKSVIANSLEVWVTDRSSSPPIEVKAFENRTEFGTSIIVGGAKQYLEFVNSTNRTREGYFGVIA